MITFKCIQKSAEPVFVNLPAVPRVGEKVYKTVGYFTVGEVRYVNNDPVIILVV